MKYGSMPVVISPVPKLHVGDEIAPIYPHQFWFWLRRVFRRPPPGPCLFRAVAKIEEHQVLLIDGRLFMSQEAWNGIRGAIS